MPKVATIIEKCPCAHRKTVMRGTRPVIVWMGKTICPICKGAGMLEACAICAGAGLRAGSTFNAPITCAQCNGYGRIPYRG